MDLYSPPTEKSLVKSIDSIRLLISGKHEEHTNMIDEARAPLRVSQRHLRPDTLQHTHHIRCPQQEPRNSTTFQLYRLMFHLFSLVQTCTSLLSLLANQTHVYTCKSSPYCFKNYSQRLELFLFLFVVHYLFPFEDDRHYLFFLKTGENNLFPKLLNKNLKRILF